MIERVPAASVDVVKVACPEPVSDAVPNAAVPSRNVIVPLAAPPVEATVTVNVTG